MPAAPRRHWPEYAMEMTELAIFMLAACTVATMLEHPSSPLREALPDGTVRRALTGMAMGLTAIALIYSRWGKRSGAHMNPAFTLTFFRLGRVAPWDAALYPAAQFTGGVLGVVAAMLLLREALGDPAVNWVATLPGMRGIAFAFAAEVTISALLMLMVLATAASPRLARYTGLFAGLMIATFITVEAPLSGMSMNPARSFGSAVVAGRFESLWLYFVAPPLGMLAAAQLYLFVRGRHHVPCPKYRHADGVKCIFCEHLASKLDASGMFTASSPSLAPGSPTSGTPPRRATL